MKSALFFFIFKKPTLSVFSFHGAMNATNRFISFRFHWMYRKLMLMKIFVFLCLGKINERMKFDNISFSFEDGKLCSMWGLPSHYSGDPKVIIIFYSFERFNFI